MTDEEKEHLFCVVDMMLFFAKQARREGILALITGLTRKQCAFASLMKVRRLIAQNLQKSTENTLSLQLGIESVKDI